MKGRMHSAMKRGTQPIRRVAPVSNDKLKVSAAPLKPAELADLSLACDWFCIHTKPQQERQAIDELRRAGYRVFCPMATVWRRSRQIINRQHVPLFPRYLFAGRPWDSHITVQMGKCAGVSTVIGSQGGFRPLAEALIRDLSDMQGRGEFDQTNNTLAPGEKPTSRQLFTEGQTVIMQGPLEGLQAIVKATSDTERVTVLLQLLGSQRPLQTVVDMVRAA